MHSFASYSLACFVKMVRAQVSIRRVGRCACMHPTIESAMRLRTDPHSHTNTHPIHLSLLLAGVDAALRLGGAVLVGQALEAAGALPAVGHPLFDRKK